MKRPSTDAVTRDSAHRPKERLPSPRFFPKLQPARLSRLPSVPLSERSRCCRGSAVGRFFDIKRAGRPDGPADGIAIPAHRRMSKENTESVRS
jgi:hypothetical protein